MPPDPNKRGKGSDSRIAKARSLDNETEAIQQGKRKSVSTLVDELLAEIYGNADLKRRQSVTTPGEWSWHESDQRCITNPRFRSNLKQIEAKCKLKDVHMLREEVSALKSLIAEESNNLVKYLKRKDFLLARREAHYDVITAVIHAISRKTRDDMKMKFSLSPGTETGFSQWVDAMKMVAQLPGGVPSEFRTKLWLQLSERHLAEQNIDWEKADAIIFNEWTNPDDEELGVQIVKDLHRTGCSLFCGAQEQNQALLKRVLLAYARWNKNVGYCQGFNMLAALILQVMDRDEKNAVKVMIYLIEGVLPESYFANNLRGLSVDMAVFRDLLRLRLPKLSKHLEALQNDTNSGTSYEPPLTNVFTMQWFLTLFSNCLPQQTVLRVWDLVFLHGNEVLLRTALAIWGILQDRIMSVESADEFYSIMGVVTREMLEFGLMDANNLIKMIVMVDPFPNELQELREKYLYNISPWTQSVQSAARKGIKLFYSDPEDQDDTEDEDKIALATAYGVFRRRVSVSGSKDVQPIGPTLDISVLKQQYAKLRQRQRQAHIIISAACSSSIPANLTSVPTVSVNHLLMGKSALVNKGRRIGPPEGSIPPPKNRAVRAGEVGKQSVKRERVVISGETLDWKDAEKRKCSTERKKFSNTDGKLANNKTKSMETCNGLNNEDRNYGEQEEDDGRISSASSTSTELCDDEFNRLSDFDPEEGNPSPTKSEPQNQTLTEGNPSEKYEEIREAAVQLLRYIEEEVNRSERLIHLKMQAVSDNNDSNGEKSAESLSTSNHDNIIVKKSPDFGDVQEEFLNTEPEVPIAGNVIDNAENRIFDRSKPEAEDTSLIRESETKSGRERDRRKSDLVLSVIQENLEMLSKFSQKREERTDEGDDSIEKGAEPKKEIAESSWSGVEEGGGESLKEINKSKVEEEKAINREFHAFEITPMRVDKSREIIEKEDRPTSAIKREEERLHKVAFSEIRENETRPKNEKTEMKWEERKPLREVQEIVLKEERPKNAKREAEKSALEMQENVERRDGWRSELKLGEKSPQREDVRYLAEKFQKEDRSRSETIKSEDGRSSKEIQEKEAQPGTGKVEQEKERTRATEERPKSESIEVKWEEGKIEKEEPEIKKVLESSPKTEGADVGKLISGEAPEQKTISKVHKEVNTDITIATDLESSPNRTFDGNQKKDQGNVDEFLISLISSKSVHRSPERFKPEKHGYDREPEVMRPFGREDLAERWKKESERIESKLEMSKSDWDLKMKRIAELENTTREKLNEIKSKSIMHRHRSLDRYEGRDREKRKSPIPRIQVPEDEAEDLERRKKKISALSFDEITSRTEKLLGANLNLDFGHRKLRKSPDENGDGARSYEYYSSPTSPEYRGRKRSDYSSPKRYDSRWKQTAEDDWLTITEENGKGTTIEFISSGRKTEKDLSPIGFNPFPTRTQSRPKELGVRLGMYPPSPEAGQSSSKKSQ